MTLVFTPHLHSSNHTSSSEAMAMVLLPDEQLLAILDHALYICDQLFADTSSSSPFGESDWSAANVLLVCKRWMRVATPSLYDTVIVRSTGQAKALAKALSRNPEFGQYIKRLRIEGPYGGHIDKVVRVSPNIVDFCFTMNLYSGGSVNGLVKTLHNLDPRRVILSLGPALSENTHVRQVENALATAILDWRNLEVFKFTGSSALRVRTRRTIVDYCEHPIVLEALKTVTSLRHVYFYHGNLSTAVVASVLGLLEQHPTVFVTIYNLEAVDQYNEYSKILRKSLAPALHTRIRLAAKTGYATSPTLAEFNLTKPKPTKPDVVFSTTLEYADDGVSIWVKICQFALAPPIHQHHNERFQSNMWFNAMEFDFNTAASLMQTSPMFKNIAAVILSQHLWLQTPSALNVFYSQVSPGLLLPTRSLSIMQHRVQPSSPPDPVRGRDYESIFALYPMFNLSSLSIPYDAALMDAASYNGHNMITSLTLESGGSHKAAVPIVSIGGSTVAVDREWVTPHGLRNLVWKGAPEGLLADMANHSFSQLQVISMLVRCTSGFETFMQSSVASVLTLKTNASVISPSMVSACSSLGTLHVSGNLKTFMDSMRGKIQHARLTTLILDFSIWASTKSFQHLLECRWATFIDLLTHDALPMLEKVQILNSSLWPTTERDIKASCWPRLSESASQRGITIVDKSGRAWRRRVQ
ncbi:hypothetical protein BKA62DRAFT_830610 [Auriculariales sp. MPI-PUGE-AT-0066]|nr:hypothetical protein BKA62DRAFT_830610 [Auriculariales sp. MPI-PUGE-AT-0066]